VLVRQAAIQRGGRLALLNWQAIGDALTKAPVPDPEILTVLLPQAPPQSLDVGLAPVRDAAHALANTADRADPSDRWLAAATWMFSARDVPAKALAAAGLLLILLGGGSTASHLIRAHLLNRAYGAVLDGVAAGSDDTVIARAEDYLRHAADAQNARTAQVMSFLREAVLRQTLRLGEAGNQDQAAELLRQYSATTKALQPGPPDSTRSSTDS
jgi:hypothetical protein